MAPTCFGKTMPSSGSDWVPAELLQGSMCKEASHGKYGINLCTGVVCSELWWYTTKCKQLFVFKVISHEVTTAATSRSSLNLRPPTICFRAGNVTITQRRSELCQEHYKVLSLRYYAPRTLVFWQTYMAHILQLIKCPQTDDTDKQAEERIRPYSITHSSAPLYKLDRLMPAIPLRRLTTQEHKGKHYQQLQRCVLRQEHTWSDVT
jgi:hypothetical protein